MRADRTRDEIEQIRVLLHAADLPVEPLVEEVTPADDELLQRIHAGDVPAPRRVATPRPAWVRPAVRIAAAAAAVVVVVAGGLVYQGVREPAAARTPALLHFSDADVASVLAGHGEPAGDALTRLAATAAAQPQGSGGDYQETTSYSWYVKSDDTSTVLVPSYESMVVAPDGSAVHRQQEGSPLDGHGRVVDGGTAPSGTGGTDDFPAGTLDPQQAAGLPRDPAALRAALLATQSGGQCDASSSAAAACLVDAVTDLSTFYVLPPDLDAALWTVLAAEPDVVRLGTTTDRLGRPGVAVAARTGAPDGPGVRVLVVSTDDGRLLEWDDVAASVPDLGVDTPAVTGFQVFLSSQRVDEPPAQ